MKPEIEQALARDLTIDITTIGRRSGRPRRIEIWFHSSGGRYIITGIPGRRDWYANLVANPCFTFHLKESAKVDLPATAVPVTDPDDRRKLLLGATSIWNKPNRTNVDKWVRNSPLVEIFLENPGGA